VKDVADQPIVDGVHYGEEIAVVPAVVVDGEDELVLLGERGHGEGLLRGDAERLLEDDVLAGLEALHGELRVGVMGCNNDGEINVGLLEHLPDTGEGLHAGQFILGDLEALCVEVANGCGQHSFRIVDELGMMFAHVECSAVADYAAADRSCACCHGRRLLFSSCGSSSGRPVPADWQKYSVNGCGFKGKAEVASGCSVRCRLRWGVEPQINPSYPPAYGGGRRVRCRAIREPLRFRSTMRRICKTFSMMPRKAACSNDLRGRWSFNLP